jgi:hypothetical protein
MVFLSESGAADGSLLVYVNLEGNGGNKEKNVHPHRVKNNGRSVWRDVTGRSTAEQKQPSFTSRVRTGEVKHGERGRGDLREDWQHTRTHVECTHT